MKNDKNRKYSNEVSKKPVLPLNDTFSELSYLFHTKLDYSKLTQRGARWYNL